MKVATSYFYQIRNFKLNMVPISTAVWDPKWFHDNQDQNYIFRDRRGIINGIRINKLIFDSYDGQQDFFVAYQDFLEKINLKPIIIELESLERTLQKKLNIKDEIIFVFIVYETPYNMNSERQYLIKKFNQDGIPCQELKYPI